MWIIGHLIDGNHQSNFYKICLCTLEFLAICSEIFRIFPAQKTIYLNISGIDLLFWALSKPVGIFSVFFRIFLAFFWNFWHTISFLGNFCQKHFWVAYVIHHKFTKKEFPFWEWSLQKHFWDTYVRHHFMFPLVLHLAGIIKIISEFLANSQGYLEYIFHL